MKNILCGLLIFSATFTAFAAARSAADLAVENPARSADDKKADERRHPRELLKFSGVKAGDVVVDLLPGKGYFTRLFASVAGPRGRVIADVPKEIENASFKPVEAGKTAVAGFKNAELKVAPILSAPVDNADVVWTSQNYHDLHIKSFIDVDVAAYNRLVYKMLKPGGHFVVVDHVAASGSTVADIEKLHRIDPQSARKEIEAAGFVLEEESRVLEKKEDHRLNVFDPAIRGQTDQFAFRFVKPKN